MGKRILRVYLAKNDTPYSAAYENLAFVTLGTIPHFTYLLPDPIDTVLEIKYEESRL